MSRFCPKKRRGAAGEFRDEQIFETCGFLVLVLVLFVLFLGRVGWCSFCFCCNGMDYQHFFFILSLTDTRGWNEPPWL